MDSGLEPQLAIPVVLVVLGAVLVYIFGFKQTEEPSLEHLAVLQSSSSFHKTRSAPSNNPKQQHKTSSSSGAGAGGAKANGHLPSANGSVVNKKSSPVAASTSGAAVNKENKPPAFKTDRQIRKENMKDPANKPEDFESGDWIPAVSRKEKVKKVTPKEAPSSPGKRGKIDALPVGLSAAAVAAPPVKAPKIEDLLAEMNVLKEIEKQNQGAKKAAPPAPAPAAVVVAEKKPKKGGGAPPAQKVEVAEKEEEEKVVTAPPPPQEKEKKAAAPKSNVAFDEMGGGDSWEEAKSRGAKKRIRTRKD